MNKLWLLMPHAPDEGPWNPWYDKTFGFVVCAPDESAARALAQEQAGDEGRHGDVWMMSRYTSCEELTPESVREGVVLQDFHAG